MTLPGFHRCTECWGTGLIGYRGEHTPCRECGGAGQVPDDDTVCPSCSHEWRKHDPEDGKCDAYPGDDHCNPHEVVATFARAALLAYARHTRGAE